MKHRVLLASSINNHITTVKKILSNDYKISIVYTSDNMLKNTLNNDFSLIIIDKNLKGFIDNQRLFSFLSDIDQIKDIPIIILEEDINNNELMFSNYGFILKNTYKQNDLIKNIDILIKKTGKSFSDTEDVQNFISSLIVALESRDKYSKNHSARVSKYSSLIAENMLLTKKAVNIIETAGLFHDIGKIGIPDKVLLKPGRLDIDEFEIIKSHPVISEKICSPTRYFNPLLPIIRGHHERYDGTGYPDNLKGEQISMGARIVAVADAFDALTSNRSYRNAFSLEKVLNIMKDGAGTQWDSLIIKKFLMNFSIETITNLLRQSSTTNYEKKENLISGTIFETK